MESSATSQFARDAASSGNPPYRGGRPLRRGSRAAARMAALLLLLFPLSSYALGTESFSLGGQVWMDEDDDGLKGVFEPAIPLVGLTLTGPSGEPMVGVAPVATGTGGEYRFDGLAAGSYRVQILPTAFQAGGPLERRTSSTRTGAVANDDVDHDDNGTDTSDPATLGVWASSVTLGPGASEPVSDVEGLTGAGPGGDDHSNLTLDFGFIAPFAIGNRVWRDLDNDGRLTASDGANPGIAGVHLTLADIAGTPQQGVAPAVTDSHGFYRFDRVGRGQFVVTVDPSNFASGGPLDGTISSEVTQADVETGIDVDDNGLDVAAPATTGITSPWIAMSLSGEPLGDLGGQASHGIADDARSDLTVDFGFYPLSSVGDHVWNDRDRDGQQSPGEPGVGGVTLALSQGGVPVATTTSAPDGSYRFTGLRHGVRYCVSAAAPDGYAFGSKDAGPDDLDSDLDPATGRFEVGPLPAGTHDRNSDIALWKPSAIGDRVWSDLDGDGRQDADEPGRGGVEVSLSQNGIQVARSTTDAAGRYRFDGLLAGTGYRVRFAPPSGEILSASGRGTAELDSTPDPLMFETPAVALAPEQRDFSIDAGLFAPVTLTALGFVDDNTNGRVDRGERGVEGISLQVSREASAVGRATTTADGSLRVPRLASGVLYDIEIATPGGYVARGATRQEVMLPASGGEVLLVPLSASKKETSSGMQGSLRVRQRWPTTVRRGSTVTVEIEVRNGPTVTRDARLVALFSTDLRPLAGAGLTRSSSRRVNAALGRLAPRARRVLKIRVQVGPSAASAQHSLVRASEPGGSSASAFTRVRVAPTGRVR